MISLVRHGTKKGLQIYIKKKKTADCFSTN